MIITVTLNPAFDHILYVSEISPGRINRSLSTTRIPGGKGINIGSSLAVLGEEVVATGFLSGKDSQIFEPPLKKTGVTINFTYTDQETRTDFYIVEKNKNRQTFLIEESFPVKLHYLNNFKSNYERLIPSAEAVVIGGSLPKGVSASYLKELVQYANQKKVKIALNLQEQLLKECLDGSQIFLICPDVRETRVYSGENLKDGKARIRVARQLLEKGVELVILNFGPIAYLAASKNEIWEGEMTFGENDPLIGVDDGLLAGFLHGYLRKGNIMEALKHGLATALSAAKNKLNYPSSRDEVEQLMSSAKLRKVE